MPGEAVAGAMETTASPESFFAQVREAFDRAAARAGVVESAFDVAGHAIRLRFAGPALAPYILPAFDHLARTADAPALTILLWDTASTGVMPPPPPWDRAAYGERGAILGYNTERFRTAFFLGAGVLCMLDLEFQRAYYWLRDARQHPVYMTGSPLLNILQWWMAQHDRQVVHAGAVGTPEGGVLLVGKGGSGKSTTTLACLHSPLSYLSDDYVILNRQAPFTVYSLYNTGKLNAASQQLLPEVARFAEGASLDYMGKSLFFVQECMPEKIVRQFPLRAILLPTVTGGRVTQAAPVTTREVLQALVPSTIHQLTGAGAEAIRGLEAVARVVPGYALALGTDVGAVPGAILDLLRRS